MEFKILEHDDDLYVLKLFDTEFNGLIISLYGIGFTKGKLYYHYNIMNETELTNITNLDILMDNIAKELYLKEII